MENNSRLPFYMAYPSQLYELRDSTVQRDLNYFCQVYPERARKMQDRIAEIIDSIDYPGSMIYDEYPDKFQIYGVAEAITEILKHENFDGIAGSEDEDGQNQAQADSRYVRESWEWVGTMVQILLCNELYRRRHKETKEPIIPANFGCGMYRKSLQ